VSSLSAYRSRVGVCRSHLGGLTSLLSVFPSLLSVCKTSVGVYVVFELMYASRGCM